MSEEKPTFKVTDRRLFNPDGTPREDIVREEEPPPAPEPTAREAATAPAPAEREASREPAAAGARQAEAPAAGAEAEANPEEFLMLVEFVASFAADALGMVAHPGGPRGEPNPPLAKQCIDMLGTLQRKTHGNLSEEEKQFLDMILSQLRMQYVSLTSGGARGGRGFTGADITGGR